MKREISVMGIQIGMTEDKHDNLRRALALIEEGFERYKKIDVICLPELLLFQSDKKKRIAAILAKCWIQSFLMSFPNVQKASCEYHHRKLSP